MPEDSPVHLTAEQARGGDIVLRKRRQRIVFAVGLAGMAVVALAAGSSADGEGAPKSEGPARASARTGPC